MRLGTALALFVTTSVAAPAAAQGLPRSWDGSDSRIETLSWTEGAVLPLRTTIGGHIAVIFAPGEAIQSVLVGDPGAIKVTVAPLADSLFVHTERAAMNKQMTVQTQLRSYSFKLEIGPANDVVYAVHFRMADQAAPTAQSDALPVAEAVERYRLKGDRSLRPAHLSDDGHRTYIKWGDDQTLPAVFALNAQGEEETVDGYMRGGILTIDRIYPKLFFRSGKRLAQAVRMPAGQKSR